MKVSVHWPDKQKPLTSTFAEMRCAAFRQYIGSSFINPDP